MKPKSEDFDLEFEISEWVRVDELDRLDRLVKPDRALIFNGCVQAVRESERFDVKTQKWFTAYFPLVKSWHHIMERRR